MALRVVRGEVKKGRGNVNFTKIAIVAIAALLLAVPIPAQEMPAGTEESAGPEPAELVVEPTELHLKVGEKAKLTATVKDASGETVDMLVMFFSRSRRSVGVTPEGDVEAYRPGEHTLIAVVPKDPEQRGRRAEMLLRVEVPVTIPNPPIASVSFTNLPSRFYADTVVPVQTEVRDTSGAWRTEMQVGFESRNKDVATIDELGNLVFHEPGKAKIVATAEDVEGTVNIEVLENPVVSFELEASTKQARTGDVVHFKAVARDAKGKEVPEFPVQFASYGKPFDTIIAPGAISHVDPDGAFVAERSGLHTVVAVAGSHSARQTIKIVPRDISQEVEVIGQGAVRDRHTSDLWIWEGVDGRDYALTGTWGADGHAYIWDVTDPKNMQLIDVVRVDARTVNDVKVSEDAKVAVISREGASNRKNGLVILDISNPRDGVQVIARYDDQLNGGVHNVFIHNNHIYAINNGRRYDIINIEDPTKPTRVGRFELDTPGHGIHDVWVEDGIAYSSNWTDGVVAVDVGGGGKGGSPNNPVKLGSHAHPNGWNHAAYPYRSKSTGTFYAFMGDEAFPYAGFNPEPGSVPDRAAGWIHVIEWDDWENPREVARYQVPEAGTHNLWIEDDIMYIGYYNGGLRVVDVSGELRGDLYKQGREIAFWVPADPEGYVPNAPFVWGPQPYKGNIFVADFNSGLWAVRLVPKEETKDDKPRDFGEPR